VAWANQLRRYLLVDISAGMDATARKHFKEELDFPI